jgi:hypothetical protein
VAPVVAVPLALVAVLTVVPLEVVTPHAVSIPTSSITPASAQTHLLAPPG